MGSGKLLKVVSAVHPALAPRHGLAGTAGGTFKAVLAPLPCLGNMKGVLMPHAGCFDIQPYPLKRPFPVSALCLSPVTLALSPLCLSLSLFPSFVLCLFLTLSLSLPPSLPGSM